ncbi:hypothetical protein NMY22_g14288 [Coprinellus aureogranulatus]|nr:hypothetical protein NMY22_g14288 [Coprinellus aureogranulatus]
MGIQSITGIIVESAALYTYVFTSSTTTAEKPADVRRRSWTIMFMASYLAGSNLAFLFIDTLPTITAISFMLINVRIGLGWAQNMARSGEKSITTGHSIMTLPFRATNISATRSIDERIGQQKSTNGSYQMHSLAVHVERTVVKNADTDAVALESRQKEIILSDAGSDHSTKRIYEPEPFAI